MKVQRQTVTIAAAAGALAYFVILGETGQRDPHPIILALNAVGAGTVILMFLTKAPGRSDRVDQAAVLGLVLFATSGVLAQFPRQAFDSVLAALLYVAAFWVARWLLAIGAARRAFLVVLMVLSALLTLLIAARWLLPVLEWWSLTGWSVIPPLDLNLPANPWGHRHDLTLLLVMLYPSWWLGRPGPLRAALATVVGILTLSIVAVDGSRNLWLALAVATVIVAAPVAVKRWPTERRRRMALALGLVAIVALVGVTGVGESILQRLVTGGPIAARFAMWESLMDAWLAKPMAGYGPGSFPWVLQLTDYFDSTSWTPRHPDSVVFQLLPEAGLLGLAAVVVVCVTVAPGLVRGPSKAAMWVLITFAFAGLAAQPTEYGFLVAVAIGWAAFAVPREPDATAKGSTAHASRGRAVALATMGCFALIAAAWTATAAAALSYGSARSEVREGVLEEAIPRLQLARRLDPGMALYARQLGTAQLLTGDATEATQSLHAAVALNPSDDLAWRILALAEAASDDAESASLAAAQAVDRQRSDATNLLLWARWQERNGNHDDAVATLAEIVQAWPEVVAAPGWDDILPAGVSTTDLIELAINRWSGERPSPETRSLQPMLLAVMTGRPDAVRAMAERDLGASLGAAYLAVMGCDPSAASLLDQAPDQARRSSLYWSLVVRQARLDGQVDASAERLFEIMTSASLSASLAQTLNPLRENGLGGFSADDWGYRRSPIGWPDYEELPSPQAGAARWLVEPRASVRRAGLVRTLTGCR